MKRREEARLLAAVKHATTDPEQIEKWWNTWPDADVGIATGDGLIVIEVDAQNGGLESLSDLEAQFGSLPPTQTAAKGDGSRQIYMSVPKGTKLKRKLAPGCTVKHDGDYVEAPLLPPTHESESVLSQKGAALHYAGERGMRVVPLRCIHTT